MAKRSSSIYHLKDGERQLCKGLWKTGTMKVQDARKHFEITDKRFNTMVKQGFIEKRGNLLRLGPSGQKYLENKLGMEYRYRSPQSHWKHDLKLSNHYLSLTPNQRDTWKTETQIRNEVSQAEYKEMVKNWKDSWTDKDRINFVPDGAYYSEEAGSYVVVESTTGSYSQQDIDQKETFVNTFYGGRMVRV